MVYKAGFPDSTKECGPIPPEEGDFPEEGHGTALGRTGRTWKKEEGGKTPEGRLGLKVGD